MLFFQSRFPRTLRRILRLGIGLLSAGLFIALGILGHLQLLDERLLEITSESLNIPQWIYTVCIPVGCAMIVGRIFQTLAEDIKEWL